MRFMMRWLMALLCNKLPWVSLLEIPVRDLYTKVIKEFNWKWTDVILLYCIRARRKSFVFPSMLKCNYLKTLVLTCSTQSWNPLRQPAGQIPPLRNRYSHSSFVSKEDRTWAEMSEKQTQWANCCPAWKVKSKKWHCRLTHLCSTHSYPSFPVLA